MRMAIVPLVVLSFAFSCAAQSSDSEWKGLEQLKPGDRVELVLKSNAKHRGDFAMLAEDAITLRINKTETGFRRDEVVRVSRLGSARRGRAALIGMAIGSAVGVAGGFVGGKSDSSCRPNEPFCFDIPVPTKGIVAAAGGVVLGAVGAGVGAAVARPARTEVYRAAVTPGRTGEVRAAKTQPEPSTSPRAVSPAPTGSN